MKILVGYATKHGATADAAALLAKQLPGEVDLCDLKERTPSPEEYDVAILGGAVYAGTLPRPLKQYCTTHEAALAQMPLGLFVCCSEATPGQFLKANLPAGLLQSARETASFGGEFRPDRLSLPERLLLKAVTKASGGKDLPSLDHEAIRSFAAAMIA